uniref:Uncharacterized protein n=1 Tax=Rhizophora mucronata TaxID=61149 RepID=A0A2P2N277_RHIMU
MVDLKFSPFSLWKLAIAINRQKRRKLITCPLYHLICFLPISLCLSIFIQIFLSLWRLFCLVSFLSVSLGTEHATSFSP